MFKNISPNVKYYLISNSFYYGGYDIIKAFLAILITENITQGKADAVGFVLAYTLIIRGIIEVPISRVTSKYTMHTKIQIVSVSYIIYGIFTALLGFSTSLWQIFFIQTFIALFDAIAYPLKWPIFTKNIEESKEELAWGMEDVMSMTVTAVFAGVGGILSDKYGLKLLFIIFGLLFAICGLTFHCIKIKRTLGMRIRDLFFEFEGGS